MSEGTNGGNFAMSDEDRALLEQELGKELEWDNSHPENYLVRGALLQCSCGTHPRRMNLPKSYGIYTDAEEMKHPFVCVKDCMFCDKGSKDGNITYFGVCKSETNDNPNKEEICLKPYNEDAKENDQGTKCTPMIMGAWLNPVSDSYVEEDGLKYLKLKQGSVLVCKYGGVIQVRESGQDYTEEE